MKGATFQIGAIERESGLSLFLGAQAIATGGFLFMDWHRPKQCLQVAFEGW
jgi:hypothetical protein